MGKDPQNVIIIIADSLRYDSVYDGGVRLPYLQSHAREFKQARSAGCWTLPATASLFTGLMPHEHGATSQTRSIHPHVVTLAERYKAQGFHTCQITANIATTDVFNLHRGFDEVRRIWKMVDPKFNRLQQFLALVGKPRLRKKLLSKDMIMAKLSSDLEMAKTWLQHTYDDIFDEARAILRENEKTGRRSFIFINLMETHFPYHIAPTFKLTKGGIFQKLRELVSLYHMVNQSFLTKGRLNIKEQQLDFLRGRQRRAWEVMANDIDETCREFHEDKENLVVFGADHGETFGEDHWVYHFSNISDGGNKVPFFILHHDDRTHKEEHTPISTKDIYYTLLQESGYAIDGPNILRDPEHSKTVLQSYWYNNKGKTRTEFRFNQLCLLMEEHRYLFKAGEWLMADLHRNEREIDFEPLGKGVNPLFELQMSPENRKFYEKVVSDFSTFSGRIPFK